MNRSMRMGAVIREGGATAELLRSWTAPVGRALRIGLTGGIGSGKSTLAKSFAQAGALVADADRIAREVVAPGGPGFEEIVRRFGAGLIDEQGGLDRRALSGIVFSDASARADLEAITHPLIAARAEEILSSAPAGGLAVYDVPLLVELDMAGSFDLVIVVEAPLDLRLDRLEGRGMGRAEAGARIGAQAGDEQRRAIANILCTNAGSLEDARRLARTLVAEWFSA